MADDPNTRPQKKGVAIPASDIPHAPFIFCEEAPAYAFMNGVVHITLSANRTWIGPDKEVVNDQVVVAYLRGNPRAMLSLRQAIDKAISFAAANGHFEIPPSFPDPSSPEIAH